MKIMIFTSAHPTDDVRVMTKIAAGFHDEGHDVVWCGPEVAFFDAARDPRIEWHLTPKGSGWLGRLRALASIAGAAHRVKNVDWIYTPDPDAAMVAVPLAKLKGAKLLFDLHEEFHNGLLRRGISQPQLAGILSLLVRGVIRVTARCSTLAIAVNQTVLDAYARPGRRALVVLNSAPKNFAAPVPKPPGGSVTAMHGKAIESNGSRVVIDALEAIPASRSPTVLFIVRGSAGSPVFSQSVFSRLESEDLVGKVELLDGVPHSRMPQLMGRCDLGLIAYGRILGEASLPNRLFEYMAAGCAVLAPSYSPEIVSILEAYGCGETVDFEDRSAVAEALRRLSSDPKKLADMGNAGRAAFLACFAWEAQLKTLIMRMEELRG